MSQITIVTAANEKFKDLAEMCIRSIEDVGHNVLVYDLGDLGIGIPFDGRVYDKVGAKIPSKPEIILDALRQVNDNDFVVWLDADTILWDNINEIKLDYDIGVTVRGMKRKEPMPPINAGVCFFKKTSVTMKFVKLWSENCKTGVSDQAELNKLLKKTSCKKVNQILRMKVLDFSLKVKLFPCSIYNNFYFRKKQLDAKITHYKSKRRSWWPRRNIGKVPKECSLQDFLSNTEARF